MSSSSDVVVVGFLGEALGVVLVLLSLFYGLNYLISLQLFDTVKAHQAKTWIVLLSSVIVVILLVFLVDVVLPFVFVLLLFMFIFGFMISAAVHVVLHSVC